MKDGLLEVHSASWLVPFLLLLLQERSWYGRELARRIADLGLEAERQEKVYRTLRQMEREGTIVSECDGTDSRLARRKYSITESGEAYLELWAGSLGRFREEVDLFHRLHAGERAQGQADQEPPWISKPRESPRKPVQLRTD